jgi:hypothetical protein
MQKQNIKQEGSCGMSLKNEVPTLKISIFFRYRAIILAPAVG